VVADLGQHSIIDEKGENSEWVKIHILLGTAVMVLKTPRAVVFKL
jgi:hypothetical protein